MNICLCKRREFLKHILDYTKLEDSPLLQLKLYFDNTKYTIHIFIPK